MYSKGKGSTVPSDAQSREKLALYVYEYLIHVGAQKAAQTFLQEIRWEKAITLAEPPGFLHSWWSVFWDLYSAAPERRETFEHSNEAKAFHDYGFVNSGFPNGIGHPAGPPVVSMPNNMEARPGHPGSMGPMGPNMHQRLPHPGARLPHPGPPMGPVPYGPGGIRGGPPPPMTLSGPPPRGVWMPPSAPQYSSASPVTFNGPPTGPGTPGVMPSPQDPNAGDPYGPPGRHMPPNPSFPGPGMHPGGPNDMPSHMINGVDPHHMEAMKNSPAGSGGHMGGPGQPGTPRDDLGPPPGSQGPPTNMPDYGPGGPMPNYSEGGMCLPPGPPHLPHHHGHLPPHHQMNGPPQSLPPGHPGFTDFRCGEPDDNEFRLSRMWKLVDGNPMMGGGGELSPGPGGPPGDPNNVLFMFSGGPGGGGSPGPPGGYMQGGPPPSSMAQGPPPPEDNFSQGMLMGRRGVK